ERHARLTGSRDDAQAWLAGNSLVRLCDGRMEITAAAVLLFAKNPQRFLPRARLRVVRLAGPDADVRADAIIGGRLDEMLEQGLARIRETLALEGCVTGLPEACWRELVVNALGHRDWSVSGADVQVRIYDDRLTVENPGSMPAMGSGNPGCLHLARNPKIFDFLRVQGCARELGEGLGRVMRTMKREGLPAPECSACDFMLRMTLKGRAACAGMPAEPDRQEETAPVQAVEPLAARAREQAPATPAPAPAAVPQELPAAAAALQPQPDCDTSQAPASADANEPAAEPAPDAAAESAPADPVQTASDQVEISPEADAAAQEALAEPETAPESEMPEVAPLSPIERLRQDIVAFCETPRTRKEVQSAFDIADRNYFLRYCLRPLLEQGLLAMTLPDKPNSPAQRYVRA
ncbi:MAG: ATP-binding protein, partial [Desulfovibrionaceae bacterium]|nr:ATP-binding protein [Desulfovibrionaceae bacterium]